MRRTTHATCHLSWTPHTARAAPSVRSSRRGGLVSRQLSGLDVPAPRDSGGPKLLRAHGRWQCLAGPPGSIGSLMLPVRTSWMKCSVCCARSHCRNNICLSSTLLSAGWRRVSPLDFPPLSCPRRSTHVRVAQRRRCLKPRSRAAPRLPERFECPRRRRHTFAPGSADDG